MLEQTAIVARVEAGMAWVETQPLSACGHCGASGACGSGLLAGLLGRRRPLLAVADSLGVAVGDRVVIGVADQLLLHAALGAYLLPLVALVIGSGLAVAAGGGDGVVALAGVLGLVAGLAVTRVGTRRAATRERFRPRLLRREGILAAQEIRFNLNDLNNTGASS